MRPAGHNQDVRGGGLNSAGRKGIQMPNIRNDSVAVAEAHRQAEIIHKALFEGDLKTEAAIAQTLLDIWQFQKKEDTAWAS